MVADFLILNENIQYFLDSLSCYSTGLEVVGVIFDSGLPDNDNVADSIFTKIFVIFDGNPALFFYVGKAYEQLALERESV